MVWVGHAACMGEIRNAHKVLVKKLGRIRHFERLRHRWEDSIKLHCNEVK
jgi:hypothetical protein